MLTLLAVTVATALTIEDYATTANPSSPRWSPDGKRVTYTVTIPNFTRNVYEGDVWLADAATATTTQLTREGNDTSPRWSPDGTQIAFLSDRGGPAQIYLIRPDGGEARQLTKEPTAIRLIEWSRDGKSIAFTRLDDVPQDELGRDVESYKRHADLHVVDAESGEVRRLTSGAFSVIAMSFAQSEIVISRATGIGLDDLYRTDLYAVAMNDGAMRPLVVRPGWDHGPVVSPDAKTVAFTSTGPDSTGDARDWLREHDLHVIPVEGGTPRALATAYDRTPESHTWDGNAIWFDGPFNTTSPVYSANEDGFTKRLDGVHADIDVHESRVASICQSLTEPPEVCIDGRALTHHNAALRNRILGEQRVVKWKSGNLEIEGLLTLPIGYKQGQRVPLITFIHGGPASNFSQSFIGYVGSGFFPHQVLAASGFAVLRPNPRGSGGYGNAFRRANFNDWVNQPWRDVESGIDKLIADGIADPNRLALAGWSYGGYLASWVAGRSHRFKAISIGGAIADLFSYHHTSDIRDYIPAYFPGLPLDLLRAQSPLWQMKKPSAKILIMHGENDERVPPSQGVMLYRRMRELGADVTMIVLPRTAHGAREPKLRLDMLKRNVEFLKAAAMPPHS